MLMRSHKCFPDGRSRIDPLASGRVAVEHSDGSSPDASTSHMQEATHPMPPLHALLIEDDRETRERLSAMLCEQACSVRAVSTGREAISHVERGVDLVMVGDLPDGDGLSIMQQLRQID